MLNGVHRFFQQDRVVYGRPAPEVLAELLEEYGKRRVLVVSTRSISGPDGLASRIAAGLGERCVGLYGGIGAHAPRQGVIEAALEARRAGADILVGVGGGSVADACKAVQIAVWQGLEKTSDLDAYRAGARGGAQVTPPADPLRLISIPTTLSAAEFTPFGGVTDPEKHAKEGYGHPLAVPRAVILDPAMTVQTPPRLWFSTGMKAVDHCVETLCAPERAPYADALATEGLKMMTRGLRATRARPDDAAARLDCQIGMWLAISGAAAGKGIGASHAIGHTLGGMLGVPHGITSCVMLPAVLAWNAGVGGERQALVAELMGAPGAAASEVVKGLCRELDLPASLGAVGVRPEQFQAIAEHTMGDRGARFNPRPIRGPEDIVEILQIAA